jgi:hypothetical protein
VFAHELGLINNFNVLGRGNRGRILNENEVIQLLQKLPGITHELIDWVELSGKEQALKASRADVLVGMHGAGLTHIQYAHDDMVLVELHAMYVQMTETQSDGPQYHTPLLGFSNLFLRFRFGSQSFQYCYRNLAKWLGFSYFAWRNTIAGNEEDVQNVKVNADQLEPVLIAALAAATSKAQSRSLFLQYGLGQQRAHEIKNISYGQFQSSNNSKSRQFSVKSSSSFPTTISGITAALTLAFFLVTAIAFQFFCKLSKRGMFILLLASVSLMTQIALNGVHQLQLQQPSSKSLNIVDTKPVLIVESESTQNVSLYSQFLLYYASKTGAFVKWLHCLLCFVHLGVHKSDINNKLREAFL